MTIGDVLYALYNEEARRFFFYDVESNPVYDEETGKFTGWKVTWWGVEKKSVLCGYSGNIFSKKHGLETVNVPRKDLKKDC